jgi:hypothetical protein
MLQLGLRTPNATFVELTLLLKMKREGVIERPCYLGLAHGLGFT